MSNLTYIENEQLLNSGSFFTASGNITVSPLAVELGSTITIGVVGGYKIPTIGQVALIGTQSMYATQSINAYSASWVSASAFIITAQTASYVSSGNIVGTITSLSASWASASISASYAKCADTASSADYFHVRNDITIDGVLIASQISSSNIYITSSYLTVTDNILLLNAQTPHLRYAGIEVFDSGSTMQEAAFLWDGQNNYFFLSSSDAGWSRRIVTGPANEADLTPNYLPVADVSSSLKDSAVYQSSSNIGIGTIIPVNKLDVVGNISCSVITASRFYGTADTASYVSSMNIVGNVTALSASFASASISASYAPVEPAYSASASSLIGTKQPLLVTGNTYTITASWATNATTAGTANAISFVPVTATSASWVSASNFITTAQTASYISSSAIFDNKVYNHTASFSVTASYVSSSNVVGIITSLSASFASASISASYANTSSWALNYTLPSQINVTGITASFTGSLIGSLAGTSSWATNATTAGTANAISFVPTTAVSASWVSASAFITTAQTASFVTASNVVGVVTSASFATTAGNAYAINFVPVTATSASWVSASAFITTAQTASYISSTNIVGNVTALSASWASASISASYAPVEPAYSSSASSLIGTKQPNLVTGNTYTITSSWATNATTAGTANAISFVPQTAVSASWASASISSSYPWYVTGGNIVSVGGNVGIGTTGPTFPLEVDTAGGIAIGSHAVGLANPILRLNTTTVEWEVQAFGSNGNFQISQHGGATNALTILPTSGNVGIGTTTPTLATLQVAGNVYATSFTGSFSGNVSPTNYACRQVPSTGAINGINAVFTWSPIPIVGTEMLFRNGILQSAGGDDYTISSGNVTFTTAPLTGDKVVMTYFY